jgi:hypothetical protein
MALLDWFWLLVFYGFVALLFTAGLFIVYESIGLFRDVVAMTITRTSSLAGLGEGRVEVTGTAAPATETLVDPVSGQEAIAYEYSVTQEEAFKDDVVDWTRFGYREKADDATAVPFYVEDAGRRVLVDPGDPDVEGNEAESGVVNLYGTRDESEHVTDPAEASAAYDAFVERHDVEETDRKRVYETARIEPGDDVYVLGTATYWNGETVIEGADGRFVVAGATQLQTFLYNTGWGVTKFAGGVALALVTAYLLVEAVAGLFGYGVPLF